MQRQRPLYVAFVASGIAGLVYEVTWSRYLGLYVGHSAYAQVLVLAVYLGGMAVGSLAVSDLSRRLERPLLWYAGTEAALAGFGLLFHPIFGAATGFTYDSVFPALGSASLVGAVRWGVAGVLILPQAVALGATFPLMAASLVRTDEDRPGRGVAVAYLANTLGGAAGVLLAGFWLVGTVGLAGTMAAAAGLNALAALLAWSVARSSAPARTAEPESAAAHLAAAAPEEGSPTPERPTRDTGGSREPDPASRPLVRLLLTVSFGTALASFAYEIGWIRMLSLVLGSATHAFELMLSAFILGLAAGAWLIRNVTDRSAAPLRLLGGIQVFMGLAALATLPLYLVSFDAVAYLVQTLRERPDGYALFNLSRYALCLAIMLPSTVAAGMTLPVITGTLLRRGAGERSIGQVYGVNTIGSVVGAGVAGLLGLPWLGLKGLLIAGAALDVALGVWLLERSARREGRPRPRMALAGLGAGALAAAVGIGVRFEHSLVTSGVFRYGEIPAEGAWEPLYYADGRTATVSAHLGLGDGMIVLSTNGKPDASMGLRWRDERRDTLPITPIGAGQDFTTQVLAPAIALAYAPAAARVANVGHGSGMTGSTFLASPSVERLVTIEIEPAMVEGSFVFLPMNGPVFADPRSSFVFDDAKSFFAYSRERFDVLFAEPSNPWVSGNASLFTAEFYERARGFLAPGGVLAQWIQIYELNDRLLLSVLAAIDRVFPSYRGFLVGDMDLLIVASADGPLREPPDWSVLDLEGVRALTLSAPPFTPEHMRALELFDETTFRAVLERGVAPNSDYRPILDSGAEASRFRQQTAEGTYAFATSRLDLARVLRGERQPPLPYRLVPARGLEAAIRWGRAAWLREAMERGGGIAPEEYPEWGDQLVGLRTLLVQAAGAEPPFSWESWAGAFVRMESELHWGTSGWAAEALYGPVRAFLDRVEAPAPARATVALLHGAASLDWAEAAGGADVLVPLVAEGERWTPPDLLLDISVVAYLRTGRVQAARLALTRLTPRTGRADWNLRNRLLEALIAEAEGG